MPMASSPVETIKEKLDIIDFLRQYLQLQPAGKNYKALCPFHREKTASFMVSPERQTWHCFGCFPPGQKVKTPFGYHNIETIDKEHFVYSGKGDIRKVLAALERNYEGELVDVFVRKLGGATSLTVDHKVKVIRPKTKYSKKAKQFYRQCRELIQKSGADMNSAIERRGDLVEIPAGVIQKDDFVLYPLNTRIADVETLNLKEYLTKSYTFGPRPPELSYNQKISGAFLKLIGYWIAEGSSHRAYIRFSLGNHEEAFAKEIVGLLEELFGLKAKIHRRPADGKKTGLEITACHAYLANIFENLCGKGAANKHIPFILQDSTPALQKVLVDAIFKGDGTAFIRQYSTKQSKSITTISRVLAEQIVDILLRNGIFPSLYIKKATKDALGVNHREAYTIVWSEEAVSQHRFTYSQEDGSKYWLLPVKEIRRKSYVGPVYNLTVEKDHSYIANNFAVANCNTGGDIFTFVMRYENIEFSEALKILAEKAGIELKRLNPAEYKYIGLLYEINDAAKKFFVKELERSDAAKKYLAERGLSKETIEEFELGFAPNSTETLTLYLIKAGFYPDDILRAGLSFKTERGMKFDRFRGRIMFPIHNHLGKVVGFTGRILPVTQTDADGTQNSAESFQRKSAFSPRESAPAKYINSPETPIFNKSKLLYGFWKSKNFIRDAKSAFLVEGQMDFLMSWQAGVKNAVASSGTALTEDHLRALRRLADELVVSFDNDDAGWQAGERAVELAEARDFEVKAAFFKDYKDPAEAVFAGKENLFSAIKNAKPAVEFYFEKYLPAEKFDARRRDSLKHLRMVLEKIKNVQSPVARTFWLKELAKRTGVDEKTLAEEMEKLALEKEYSSRKSEAASGEPRQGREETEQAAPKKFSRWELLTQRCLAAALSRGNFDDSEDYFSYIPGQYREIFAIFQNGGRRSDDPILDELMNFIVFQQKEAGFEEFEELKRQLYKEYLKERRQELVDAVKQAERSGDERLHHAAIQELDRLPSG